jgi:protein-S-isoprenylcysteine O-methyltransferase Ste14
MIGTQGTGCGMLTDQLQTQGQWLFRWRSFLPLILAPLILVALLQRCEHFTSVTIERLMELMCLAVALLGLVIRVMTVGFVPKGTTGRGTKSMRAETINMTGMYSIVRHTVYVGNCIIFLAFLLLVGQWWLTVVGSLVYWLYYERIMIAEESFLYDTHGETYQEWAARTPAILPRLRNWVSPRMPFSWRSVLRREYTTFFLIVLLFTATDMAEEVILHKVITIDPMWTALFGIAAVVYFGCRSAKKFGWLTEIGR